MEDMSAQGTTYGSVSGPWVADRVRAGLKQLSLLHAACWGTTDANVSV